MAPTLVTVGQAPKPMPMAIMRNAHEVIRGAMKEIMDLLEAGEATQAKALWKDFYRFQQLHATMEEGSPDGRMKMKGLFKMMDENADNVATENGLRDQHTSLETAEKAAKQALEAWIPNAIKAKDAFSVFAKENEAHLVKEEEIMMPVVQKMVKAGVPVKKHIKTDLMPILMQGDNMEFFIRFANTTLEKYETGQKQPKTRVMDQALWALASPEQWQKWDAWIQESLSEEKYHQVMAAIHAWKTEQEFESRSAWA